MGGVGIPLDKDIRFATDGMIGEVQVGLRDGLCKPTLAKDGFESGLDYVELDDRLEVVSQLKSNVTITGTCNGLTPSESNHDWFFFLGRRDTKDTDDFLTDVVGIGAAVD